MEYQETAIYRTLRERTHRMERAWFSSGMQGAQPEVCPVTLAELHSLLEAVPAIYRWERDGDYTLDPVWGWRFRVMPDDAIP